jgi:hypothetical protein
VIESGTGSDGSKRTSASAATAIDDAASRSCALTEVHAPRPVRDAQSTRPQANHSPSASATYHSWRNHCGMSSASRETSFAWQSRPGRTSAASRSIRSAPQPEAPAKPPRTWR